MDEALTFDAVTNTALLSLNDISQERDASGRFVYNTNPGGSSSCSLVSAPRKNVLPYSEIMSAHHGAGFKGTLNQYFAAQQRLDPNGQVQICPGLFEGTQEALAELNLPLHEARAPVVANPGANPAVRGDIGWGAVGVGRENAFICNDGVTTAVTADFVNELMATIRLQTQIADTLSCRLRSAHQAKEVAQRTLRQVGKKMIKLNDECSNQGKPKKAKAGLTIKKRTKGSKKTGKKTVGCHSCGDDGGVMNGMLHLY